MKDRAVKKPSRTDSARGPDANQLKAVREFERTLKVFHQGKFAEARDRFQALRDIYSQEARIAHRADLYLRACETRLRAAGETSAESEDPYYHAVLLTNNGQTDEVIPMLEKALGRWPQDDRLLYLLAINHLRKGEREKAMADLREAIRLRELNRNLARNDPEFEDIREDRDFIEVVSKES